MAKIETTRIRLKPADIAIADKTKSAERAKDLETALADVKAGRVRRFKS